MGTRPELQVSRSAYFEESPALSLPPRGRAAMVGWGVDPNDFSLECPVFWYVLGSSLKERAGLSISGAKSPSTCRAVASESNGDAIASGNTPRRISQDADRFLFYEFVG